MSVEKLLIQCQCGGDFVSTGETITTRLPKHISRCEKCQHEIYVIEVKEEDLEYDPHLGYKS